MRTYRSCAGAPLGASLALLLCGCVTTYQPLSGLARPVAVDTQRANLAGVRLFVNCVQGGDLDRQAALRLCRKLGTLFANQGAKVRTNVDSGYYAAGVEEEAGDGSEAAQEDVDLTLELKARVLNQEANSVTAIFSYMTLTMIPLVTDYTFAQDVTIRDASGFLLGVETLKARFIHHFGLGYWALNWLLDRWAREEDERVGGAAATRDFSRDFYGHLSQMVFNASMRQRVLRDASTPRVAGPG